MTPLSLSNVLRPAGRNPQLVSVIASITLLFGGQAVCTRAAVVYDSGGFESPRFAPFQPLQGQDVTAGPWQKDAGSGTATITTNNPNAGLQAVQVMRNAAADGDTRWWVTKPITPTSALNIVAVDFDLRVGTSLSTFGPAFGVEAYDGAKIIGAVMWDSGSGAVYYYGNAGGQAQLLSTGTSFLQNQYHHFTLSLNYTDKTYSIFADQSLIRTQAFVDNTATAFSDADITTVYVGSPSETATALFDNYTVSQVPEPSAAVMLGLGAFASCAWRHRRHAKTA